MRLTVPLHAPESGSRAGAHLDGDESADAGRGHRISRQAGKDYQRWYVCGQNYQYAASNWLALQKEPEPEGCETTHRFVPEPSPRTPSQAQLKVWRSFSAAHATSAQALDPWLSARLSLRAELPASPTTPTQATSSGKRRRNFLFGNNAVAAEGSKSSSKRGTPEGSGGPVAEAAERGVSRCASGPPEEPRLSVRMIAARLAAAARELRGKDEKPLSSTKRRAQAQQAASGPGSAARGGGARCSGAAEEGGGGEAHAESGHCSATGGGSLSTSDGGASCGSHRGNWCCFSPRRPCPGSDGDAESPTAASAAHQLPARECAGKALEEPHGAARSAGLSGPASCSPDAGAVSISAVAAGMSAPDPDGHRLSSRAAETYAGLRITVEEQEPADAAVGAAPPTANENRHTAALHVCKSPRLATALARSTSLEPAAQPGPPELLAPGASVAITPATAEVEGLSASPRASDARSSELGPGSFDAHTTLADAAAEHLHLQLPSPATWTSGGCSCVAPEPTAGAHFRSLEEEEDVEGALPLAVHAEQDLSPGPGPEAEAASGAEGAVALTALVPSADDVAPDLDLDMHWAAGPSVGTQALVGSLVTASGAGLALPCHGVLESAASASASPRQEQTAGAGQAAAAVVPVPLAGGAHLDITRLVSCAGQAARQQGHTVAASPAAAAAAAQVPLPGSGKLELAETTGPEAACPGPERTAAAAERVAAAALVPDDGAAWCDLQAQDAEHEAAADTAAASAVSGLASGARDSDDDLNLPLSLPLPPAANSSTADASGAPAQGLSAEDEAEASITSDAAVASMQPPHEPHTGSDAAQARGVQEHPGAACEQGHVESRREPAALAPASTSLSSDRAMPAELNSAAEAAEPAPAVPEARQPTEPAPVAAALHDPALADAMLASWDSRFVRGCSAAAPVPPTPATSPPQPPRPEPAARPAAARAHARAPALPAMDPKDLFLERLLASPNLLAAEPPLRTPGRDRARTEGGVPGRRSAGDASPAAGSAGGAPQAGASAASGGGWDWRRLFWGRSASHDVATSGGGRAQGSKWSPERGVWEPIGEDEACGYELNITREMERRWGFSPFLAPVWSE
ncbi:hypothetical protein HYH03_004747 [Edaphochlamys debaryana]|uniref:Uncharacterized protein n=1 Tax=Edaphochlamys debaryana TaxID=47281 RepID=A0A836C2T8_9CHLO|nr:hypothetical protein HYH03_004747 [Edaphochlamys debaryana]|eukprot:KAG2497157.1 hypothetical protein HYH03_004747 [Edaphochlamys debaryana]